MAKQEKKKKKIEIYNENKIPPQAIDLEELILGAILVEKGAILKIRSIITSGNMFYKDCNKILYNCMLKMSDNDLDIDVATVPMELKRLKQLEEVGSYEYIAGLTNKIASATHIVAHSRYVVEMYLKREYIRLASEVARKSYDNSSTIDEISEYLLKELDNILVITESKDSSDMKSALQSMYEELYTRKEQGHEKNIILTGFERFDKIISLDLNNTLVISAIEESAKTQFVIALARGMCTYQDDIAILWYSLEDPKEKILRRFLSQDILLDDKQLMSKKEGMSEEQWNKIAGLSKAMGNYNIKFHDKAIDILTLRRNAIAWAIKATEEGKRPVVIIDNFGLVDCDIFGANEKDAYVSAKIMDIKQTSGALVIVVHHLTKEVKKPENLATGYRPRMEFVRGNARIVDYCDISIIANKPTKYPDLMNEYKNYIITIPEKLKAEIINRNTLFELFDDIHPTPKGLVEDTRKVLKEFIVSGKTLSWVYEKYSKYILHLKTENKGRKPGYKSKMVTLLAFLQNKLYKEDVGDNTGRDSYLFGTKTPCYEMLKTLWLAEVSKNRGEDVSTEDKVMRYDVDVRYNVFKEI